MCLGLGLKAQFLDPESEWFVAEDFFIESEIKKHHIHTISISKSTKNDNATIKKQSKTLHYIFDTEGLLFQSKEMEERFGNKRIKVKRFKYNNYHQLIEMHEEYSYFSFLFVYHYKDHLLSEIIKINPKKSDTLYHKRFQNDKTDSTLIISTINDIGKAYKKEVILKRGNLKSIKTTFSRNPRFKHTKFFYQDHLLTSIHSKTNERNEIMDRSTDFIYDEERLTDVLVFEQESKVKRFGMVYGPEGLLKNIVIRNFREKNVEIFTFDYEFYSSN